MGGSQRLPTMDERIRELEENYRNNERIKTAIVQGMKEIRMKLEDIEQAKELTDKEISDLKVHIALIDKIMLNGKQEESAPVKAPAEIWLTQTQAIKVFNDKYGFALPMLKGLANPFMDAGYLEGVSSNSGSIRYKITPTGSKLGWLKESSGNISVLESKLDEVKKVVAAYYRNLYKEI